MELCFFTDAGCVQPRRGLGHDGHTRAYRSKRCGLGWFFTQD